MQLIQSIRVEQFRSLADVELDDVGNLTAIAGLNSSGKSNLLRALNAFFTGYTDPGQRIEVDRDYNVHAPIGKKKRIRIAISFSLPAGFNFRKGLESVKSLVGQDFTIVKEWTRDTDRPSTHLNGDPIGPKDTEIIESFLSLINFRYIPNRVLPLDVIRDENRRLRDVIVKRLSGKAANQSQLFQELSDTSKTVFSDLEKQVRGASSQLDSVRLATPNSWQDLVFAFGYKLGLNGKELEDSVQGSGLQSLLMLATLALIDCDYNRWFGWKQATVWALEEPESSLHTLLEARVSAFLADLAAVKKNRLQVICTTHSDLVLQYADRVSLFQLKAAVTNVEENDKLAVLEKGAQTGVSRWVHPLLAYPLNPILLVEGKFDFEFLQQALNLIKPQSRIRVAFLEQMKPDSSGGVDDLEKYLKASKLALAARATQAPVAVLLDHSAAAKKSTFEKIISDSKRLKVEIWPITALNPKLTASFRGIERTFSDRMITEATALAPVVATRADGRMQVAPQEEPTLKKELNRVVRAGLKQEDLIHCKSFLVDLANDLESNL